MEYMQKMDHLFYRLRETIKYYAEMINRIIVHGNNSHKHNEAEHIH